MSVVQAVWLYLLWIRTMCVTSRRNMSRRGGGESVNPPAHISMRGRVGEIKNTPTSKHKSKGWWWVSKPPGLHFDAREGWGRSKILASNHKPKECAGCRIYPTVWACICVQQDSVSKVIVKNGKNGGCTLYVLPTFLLVHPCIRKMG